MTQFNSHNNYNSSSNPPPRLLPVIEKAKSIYKQWLSIHRNIERTARFGLGNKIDSLFLDLLEILRKSFYAPADRKIPLLETAIDKIDGIKFFLQLLWEAQLVHNNHYIALGTEMENLGKIVGGWKKGLLSKTSAKPYGAAEERKQ